MTPLSGAIIFEYPRNKLRGIFDRNGFLSCFYFARSLRRKQRLLRSLFRFNHYRLQSCIVFRICQLMLPGNWNQAHQFTGNHSGLVFSSTVIPSASEPGSSTNNRRRPVATIRSRSSVTCASRMCERLPVKICPACAMPCQLTPPEIIRLGITHKDVQGAEFRKGPGMRPMSPYWLQGTYRCP
jgi:hypothetical protein